MARKAKQQQKYNEKLRITAKDAADRT